MGEAFNPYQAWLDIPLADQPPTFYRLLGIRELEDRAEQIQAAADGRRKYVEAFCAGEHAGIAAQLLVEIEGARECLLNPTAKADYDQRLSAASAAAATGGDVALPEFQPPTTPAQPVAQDSTTAPDGPLPEFTPPVSESPKSQTPAREKSTAPGAQPAPTPIQPPAAPPQVEAHEQPQQQPQRERTKKEYVKPAPRQKHRPQPRAVEEAADFSLDPDASSVPRLPKLEMEELLSEFRQQMSACRQLYLAGMPHTSGFLQKAMQPLAASLENLHKGLLIKVFAIIAEADSRWTPGEIHFARALMEHLGRPITKDEQLRRLTENMAARAKQLDWNRLLKPFRDLPQLRGRVSELHAVTTKVANLVAKSDGTVSASERAALREIAKQISLHPQTSHAPSGGLGDILGPSPTAASVEPARTLPQQEEYQLQEEDEYRLQEEDTNASTATESENDEWEYQLTDDVDHASEPAVAISLPSASELDQVYQLQPEHEVVEVVDALFLSEEQLARTLAEADSLVALESAKQEMHEVANLLRLQYQRRQAGLPEAAPRLHAIFSGDAGTGKSIVARLWAELLAAGGMLRHGLATEMAARDLLAAAPEQSAALASDAVDRTLGGLLVIDDAHELLVSPGPAQTAAWRTIVQRMDSEQHRLVVVLTAPANALDPVWATNEDLARRFQRRVAFRDYSPVEIGQIFQQQSQRSHYHVTGPAQAKLLLAFQRLCREPRGHFAGGSLAQAALEEAVDRMASRIAGKSPLTHELLTTIEAEDIEVPGIPQEFFDLQQNAKFHVACPGCGSAGRFGAEILGRKVKCSKCNHRFLCEWPAPCE